MTTVKQFLNILSNEEIDYILNLPQVINAKNETNNRNNVYFTIPLTTEIKSKIYQELGLNLNNIENIPMRWIKGNMHPHVDVGISDFNDTYLIYLTESSGDLVIDNQLYPINKNYAYVFNEGLSHQTINTGNDPRLLIGPMNENGLSVGAISNITGDGNTTIYIRQNEDEPVQYSQDGEVWTSLNYPCGIQNTNTELGMLKVIFTTDITLSNEWEYFECFSSHIQFGSDTLDNGIRPKITFDNVSNYQGLIINGYTLTPGNNNIHIYNLDIQTINGSTLNDNSGWLCRSYFANNSSNNYIINCNVNGPVGLNCGGLVGNYAAQNVGNLTIIGCSFSGNIDQSSCGGIIGSYAANNEGSVTCDGCWVTGNISGINSGGIIGTYAGSSDGSVTITNCYSTGIISGDGAGGICGGNPTYVTINNSYSTGAISGNNSGGIVGKTDDEIDQNVIISNTYTLGNINGTSNAGGICGYNPPINITITYSYTTGTTTSNKGYIIGGSATVPGTCYSEAANTSSGWFSTMATTILLGSPNPVIGTVWYSPGFNQPYELTNMGYNPYSNNNIYDSSLNKSYEITLNAGNSSNSAILSNKTYRILQKKLDGVIADVSDTITINSNTGIISTTSSTEIGTYIIYIRNDGSYNITEITLIVNKASDCMYKYYLYKYIKRVELYESEFVLKNINNSRKNFNFVNFNTNIFEFC